MLAKNNFKNPQDSLMFDGVFVHHLSTVSITAFNQCADSVASPHIFKQLKRSTCVDTVWDTYITGSIKASTKGKQGKGIR